MGVPRCFTIFLFFLFLISGSSVAEKPPLEAIQQNRKLDNQENQIPFYSSVSTTQLDTVPIVNPTTPGTVTPIVNPAPITTLPPPATTTTPTGPPITTTPTAPATTTTPTGPPITTTPTAPAITTTPTPTTTTPAASGGAWCIASPTASETALQVALDYACGYGGSDCSAIQASGSCYNPNTLRDHASYAFNDYYHKNPAPTSCVFGGTAQLTYTDPSTGNCHYASSTSTTPTPPSISSPVNPYPTPPMTPTITSPTVGGGSTVYGSPEPSGLPSSAISLSCSSLLYFIATGLMGSLLAANYL